MPFSDFHIIYLFEIKSAHFKLLSCSFTYRHPLTLATTRKWYPSQLH